jgi:hypothetical protein
MVNARLRVQCKRETSPKIRNWNKSSLQSMKGYMIHLIKEGGTHQAGVSLRCTHPYPKTGVTIQRYEPSTSRHNAPTLSVTRLR